MEKLNQSRNFKIAATGVFGALSVILSITPLGYIMIPGTPINLTTMHITAILAAVTAGLVPGMCVGFIFGLTSFIKTAMTGGTGLGVFFLNPLVSVLPRILFPMAAYFVFKLLCLIPKMPKVISASVAAAAGTFCNTLFVMLGIYIVAGDAQMVTGMNNAIQMAQEFGISLANIDFFTGFVLLMAVMLAANGIWEILGAVIITAAVISAMYVSSKKKSKLSAIETELETETSAEKEKNADTEKIVETESEQ